MAAQPRNVRGKRKAGDRARRNGPRAKSTNADTLRARDQSRRPRGARAKCCVLRMAYPLTHCGPHLVSYPRDRRRFAWPRFHAARASPLLDLLMPTQRRGGRTCRKDAVKILNPERFGRPTSILDAERPPPRDLRSRSAARFTRCRDGTVLRLRRPTIV